MDLSIVSVAYNNRQQLAPFLDSILSQRIRDRAEIIIVDNGSTDGSVEFLRERGEVSLVENSLNAGYAVAMNRGIQVSRGSFLVLCNTDVIFRPGSLEALALELETEPLLGGVSPVIETPGNPPLLYPLLKTNPGLYYGWNFFSGMMFKFPHSRLINWNLNFQSNRTTRDIPWMHGACGMFRREALRSVGSGYDERFFLYFEDADLGRALRKRGWRLRICPEARILHLEGQSSKQKKTAACVHFMESWHLYHRKHSKTPWRCCIFLAVLAGLLLQLAACGLKRLLGARTNPRVVLAYLATHFRAPFQDLEARRRQAVERIKQTWKPLPENPRRRIQVNT